MCLEAWGARPSPGAGTVCVCVCVCVCVRVRVCARVRAYVCMYLEELVVRIALTGFLRSSRKVL